jgi:hypothetical protein
MKLNRRKLRMLIESQMLKEMFPIDMMDNMQNTLPTGRSSVGMSGMFGADDYELDALFDEVKALYDRHIETHPLFESLGNDDDLKRQAKDMLSKPEIQDAARQIDAQKSNSNIKKIAVRIMIAAIASLIAGAVGGGIFGAMLYILTSIALTPDSGHDFYRAEQLGGDYGMQGYDAMVSAKASAAMSFGFKVAFVCCVVYVLHNHYKAYKRSNS